MRTTEVNLRGKNVCLCLSFLPGVKARTSIGTLNKSARAQASKQNRDSKRDAVMAERRLIGSGPPLVVGLLSLSSSVDPRYVPILRDTDSLHVSFSYMYTT